MHTGCTLLFYETYGKSSCPEQELSPCYTLLAEDSIVQAIPEHPKKENVFCLSNGYGDVYLLQVRSTRGSHTDSLHTQLADRRADLDPEQGDLKKHYYYIHILFSAGSGFDPWYHLNTHKTGKIAYNCSKLALKQKKSVSVP